MKVSKEEQEKLGRLGKLGNRRDIKLGRKVHHRKGTVITVLLFMVCFLCLFSTGTKTKAAYTDEMAANMRYLFSKGYVLLDTSNLNVQSNGVGPNWKKAGTLYYKTESGSYVASVSSSDISLNPQEQAMITQMKQSNIYCFDVSKESSSTISFAYSKEGNKQAFYTTKAYNTAEIKGNLYAYLAQTTVNSVPVYMIGRVSVPDVEPAKVEQDNSDSELEKDTQASITPTGKLIPTPTKKGEEEERGVDVEEEEVNSAEDGLVTIYLNHDFTTSPYVLFYKNGTYVSKSQLASSKTFTFDLNSSTYDSFCVEEKDSGNADENKSEKYSKDDIQNEIPNYGYKMTANLTSYKAGEKRTISFSEYVSLSDRSLNIPTGTYTKSDDSYYVKSTFYDYYSDAEILYGTNRKGYTGTMTAADKVQAHEFNKAVAKYFEGTQLAVSESSQKPLYFGDFYDSSFYGSYTANYLRFDRNFNSGPANNGKAKQGLVNDKLVDGNLVMGSDNTIAPYFNKDFLRGNNSLTENIGYVFENVDFPFVLNESTGYWEFNSYDASQSLRMKRDGEQYYLERTGVAVKGHTSSAATGTSNFFPFNDAAESGNPKALNYGFGAKIEIPFYMTSDGKVTMSNNTEKDIKFEFLGDDDIWIFIDDDLVLDIGGDHSAVSGSINFATLEATTTVSTGEITKKFSRPSSAKKHVLTLFYMERGLWESNMKISFNFPKTQNLTVEKELDTSDVNPIFSEQMELLKNVSFGIEMKNLVTTYGPYEEGSTIPSIEEEIDAINITPTPEISKDTGGGASYETLTSGYSESDTRDCVLKYQCPGEKGDKEGQEVTDKRSIYIWNQNLPDKLKQHTSAATRIKENGYIQFDTYLDRATSAAAYIALIDGDGNRIGAWTSDLNSYTGTGGYMTAKSWSTRRIMIGKLEQKVGSTFAYDNIVGFQFAFWGNNTVYVDNISIYASAQYGASGGFEKPQDEIKDYGSATSHVLEPINGAKYTLGDSENYIDRGTLYLKHGEQARFSDQFRKHSYIYLNEFCDTNVFDVSWKITEQGLISEAKSGTMSGKGTLVDDGRTAPSPTPADLKKPTEGTMLFSSYTGNASSTYFYDMSVKYTNKVKTGTLTIKKQLKNDTAATLVEQKALLDTELPYYVKITFTNIAGLINNEMGYDTTQDIVVCEAMYVKDGAEIVTISGIPAGTEYAISEIKKETISEQVYTSGLDGNDFILEGIGKKVGDTIDYTEYNQDTQIYSGVISADANSNDIIITNDINPVTEGDDLSGEKKWELGANQVISPSAIPKPESVSVKLQKRLKVRDKTTDTTEEFQFSDVNEDETALILKTPISLQIKAETSTQDATWVTANGVTYQIKLENKGDWKFAIKGLPKYGKSSQGYRREYEYRLIETAMNYKDNLYIDSGNVIDVKVEADGTYQETSTGFTPSGGTKQKIGEKTVDEETVDVYGYDITNTYNPLTTLEITKVSGKDNNVKLEGVEFLLQRIQSGSGESVIFDDTFNGNTGKMEGTTGNAGTYSFLNLPDGTYRLTEIKTKSGYSLLAKAIDIEISAGGVCRADGKQVYLTGTDKNTLAITINNQGVTNLPMTGSRGRWIVIGLGIFLVALGEGYYLWNMYHPEAKGAFKRVKTAEGFEFDLGFDEDFKREEKLKNQKQQPKQKQEKSRKVKNKDYGKSRVKRKNVTGNSSQKQGGRSYPQAGKDTMKRKNQTSNGTPKGVKNNQLPVAPRVNPERIYDDTNKTGQKDEKTKEKKEIDVII